MNPSELSSYYYELGLGAETNQDYEYAIIYFTQAIEAKGDCWAAYHRRALCFIAQQKYYDAYGDLTTAQRIKPNSVSEDLLKTCRQKSPRLRLRTATVLPPTARRQNPPVLEAPYTNVDVTCQPMAITTYANTEEILQNQSSDKHRSSSPKMTVLVFFTTSTLSIISGYLTWELIDPESFGGGLGFIIVWGMFT